MILARGKVFLGTKIGSPSAFSAAAQFTFDPKIERVWPPRLSMLKGIGGTVTEQDFGLFAVDMVLTLTSEGNWITADFKNYVDGLRAVRGAQYSYKDYTGLEGKVKILDFSPEATFVRDGAFVLYEYSLRLQVKTLSKLNGATYTGS